ncbi:protein FAR1-RELATED SEQUENCE 1-like [Silene latifolia]|uniref:protein FAR1-RELATED SEQUENCE 1-like n=1 Tax=Silene latifolia TaxID=37657 RepID=UPI003D76E72B
MTKVTDKVGITICKDTDFLSRLNDVVWSNDMEPEEFEENWAKVISDFSLEGNKWLTAMFSKRDQWIPAYFKNVPMGNILKTTQRSESANSFFKRFKNTYGTLVEFWMRFESAMDQQRHTLKLLEAKSDNSMPETLFGLKWEAHAAKVYIHEMFYEIQKQVKFSVNACSVCGYTPPDTVTNFDVSMVENVKKRKRYVVEYNGTTMDVIRNWECLVENYDPAGNTKFGMPRVWFEIYTTLGILKRKEEADLREFAKIIREFREKLKPNPKPLTKEQQLEVLLNYKAPKEVRIIPPNVSKNKGSGKREIHQEKTKKKSIENDVDVSMMTMEEAQVLSMFSLI